MQMKLMWKKFIINSGLNWKTIWEKNPHVKGHQINAMSYERKFLKNCRCKFLGECTCVSIPTTVIKNTSIKMKGLSAKMCHYQQYCKVQGVYFSRVLRAKEGSRMEGTLQTDLWKSETSREIKKS